MVAHSSSCYYSIQSEPGTVGLFPVSKTEEFWLTNQAATGYEEGVHKLVSRYDKCLNVNVNYVER